MSVKTWNTAPDYDEWGSDTYWSCDEWIQWHKLLVQHFGQQPANDLWNYAYAQSGNLSANLNCRTFNSAFRDYVAQNNLQPYENAGVLSPVLQTYGTASDVLTGGLKGVSSLFSGNNFQTILRIALIGGGVLGAVYVYKTFKK